MEGTKYNQLEIARILGEPLDPKKPYPDLVSLVADTDTADPDEYVYYYDVLVATDKVHTITGTGELTSEGVTPDTPTQFTFVDLASPEYYVKITDLASAKEATLARKLKTVNRALDMYENFYIISLAQAGAITSGNQEELRGTDTSFNFRNMIEMIDDVIDYSDSYVLIVGATVDKDIKLWDWTDNKYNSMVDAWKDLGVTTIRVNGSVTIDGSSSAMLNTNRAYLVGRDSVTGRPFLFVRKRLNDIDLLGGAIKQDGTKPQRLVFVSPNPIAVTVGSARRYLAVGLTGYEEIVAACVNPYAVSEFVRQNTIGGN